MKPFAIVVAASAALLCIPSARAGGWLWLTAEFEGKGTIYRYNIATGAIDHSATPALPPGASHWNNGATDGEFLYLGSPTTSYFGVYDIMTGALVSAGSYSPLLGGHKEDGAHHPSKDTLWRITFSGGALYETSKTDGLLNTFSGTSGLVGLEWVGETLYATHYNSNTIGTINFGEGDTITFTAFTWAAGAAPASNRTAGLAYDAQADVLYLATWTPARLYSVTFDGAEASATLVAELGNVGYPSGGLADGMGWVPGEPSCAGDLDGDGDTDTTDLNILLSGFGCVPGEGGGCPGDLDNDGDTDTTDLNILLSDFGCA